MTRWQQTLEYNALIVPATWLGAVSEWAAADIGALTSTSASFRTKLATLKGPEEDADEVSYGVVTLDDYEETTIGFHEDALKVVRARRQEKEARIRYASMARMSREELDQWLRRRRVTSVRNFHVHASCTCGLYINGRLLLHSPSCGIWYVFMLRVSDKEMCW